MASSIFKPGDRVRCIYESDDTQYGSGGGRYFGVGDCGEVISIMLNAPSHVGRAYFVSFDKGEHWYCHAEELAREKANGLFDI